MRISHRDDLFLMRNGLGKTFLSEKKTMKLVTLHRRPPAGKAARHLNNEHFLPISNQQKNPKRTFKTTTNPPKLIRQQHKNKSENRIKYEREIKIHQMKRTWQPPYGPGRIFPYNSTANSFQKVTRKYFY